MNQYQQHPLSAAFPAMSQEQFEKIRDGEVPASKVVLESLLATSWFKSLKKSQRALYVAGWFHHLKQGSNQFKRVIKLGTPRHRAEGRLLEWSICAKETSHAA